METKKSNLEFSKEKFEKAISNLNLISEKISAVEYGSTLESDKNKDSERNKKNQNYVKKYLEHLRKSQDKDIISILKYLLDLSSQSWAKNGDEFIEELWNLYDNKGFHIFNSEMALTYYEYFLNMYFFNSKNLNILLKHQLFIINKDSKKVESYFTLEKFNQIQEEFSFSILNSPEDALIPVMEKNFLIDICMLLLICNLDIKASYTSISAFIVGTDGSVMKLFKVLSMFGLCLWQIEKKENFLPGLLYIVGGVLRDHGKSYLKTKGILDQNLSYHKCPKDKQHENGFFSPKNLTSKECDYIELYFLPIMKEFLKTIISAINFGTLKIFWDDCLPLFYKNLEIEELDSEDIFPADVEIFHFLNLFLCDFNFFFLSNFCYYNNNRFTSNFFYFDEFINYTLSIIWRSCRNVCYLFEYSEKKRKFLESECEKTEYSIKDCYNHYGLSLIFFLFLFGKYSPVNILNERDPGMETSFLPLIIDKYYYLELYESALFMILKSENISEIRFVKNYEKITFEFLKSMCIIFKDIDKRKNQNYKISYNLIFEFFKFDDDKINISVLKEFFSLEIKEDEKTLTELLKMTNRKKEIYKILKIYNLIVGNNKIDVKSLISTIKVLSLNASILNEDTKNVMQKFINESGVESSNFNEEMSKLLEHLKNYQKKDNYEVYFKFKEEIIEIIESLKI